jgi:EPS-associated MarR family transcriptional regulator
LEKLTPESPTPGEQLDLMRLLSEQPAASQREISARLGLSLGKANYLVRALLEKGLVKVQNFQRSDNKMAYVYLLTPSGVSEKVRLTRAFLAHKRREFELLKSEIESLQNEVETDGKASRRKA